MTTTTKIAKPTTVAEATAAFDAAVAAADGAAALSAFLEYRKVYRAERNRPVIEANRKIRAHNEATAPTRAKFAQLTEAYGRWAILKHARTHIATGVANGSTSTAADVEDARRAWVSLALELQQQLADDGYDASYIGVAEGSEPRPINRHGAYDEHRERFGGDSIGAEFGPFLEDSLKRQGI